MIKNRIYEIDVLRGFAIFLMVIFHFSYDLTIFRYVQIDFLNDSYWVTFRVIIVGLFLSMVGMSLYISYHKKIYFNKLIRRSKILLLACIAISIGTYFSFPNQWIFFGIIHFVLIASIIGVFFVKIPFTSLIIGIVIIILSYMNIIHLNFLMEWARNNLNLPYQTMDLVPLFPWMGAVLIGIYLQYQNLFGFKFSKSKIKDILSYLGKRSLLIYMIHQPILFSIVWAYYTLTNS
jgi:uncharacterized membrane protein